MTEAQCLHATMAFDFESPEGNSLTCMSVRELHILGLPPHANCAGSIVSCARALDTRVAHMSHHTIYTSNPARRNHPDDRYSNTLHRPHGIAH